MKKWSLLKLNRKSNADGAQRDFGPALGSLLLVGSLILNASATLAATPVTPEGQRAPARLIDQLSPENQAALKEEGVQIVFTQNQPGPWPKITIFQKIKATPEECMAVFSDFELQEKYIPRMVSSKIINRPDALTADVESVLDLPRPFGSESYVMRERIGSYSLGGIELGYRTDWELVRSTSFRDAEGKAMFEEFDGGTLMFYQNGIYPSNPLAGAVKKEAIKGMRQSASAIRGQIEKEKAEQIPLLVRQIEQLRESLRGEHGGQ